MKGNHWICIGCSDHPGFHSKGSLRAHAQRVHDIKLQKLKMKEILRDDFKMETKKSMKTKWRESRVEMETQVIAEQKLLMSMKSLMSIKTLLTMH